MRSHTYEGVNTVNMKEKVINFSTRIFRVRFFFILVFILLTYFTFSATTTVNYSAAQPGRDNYKAIIGCPELTSSLREVLADSTFLSDQGIFIETLDGGTQLAAFNENRSLNPASALKIATSLAALEKWGPTFQFQTALYLDGQIDHSRQMLHGNLILYSEGDPTFRLPQLKNFADELRQAGIRTVNGDLVIDGPLCVNSDFSEVVSAEKVFKYLQRAGLRFTGDLVWGTRQGTLFYSQYSQPLRDILYFQNAHSSNPIAERIGNLLGGPDALTLYLVQSVGIELEDIFITHSSGLDYNRISPRAMLKILRKFFEYVQQNNLTLDQLMPVAGVDVSTVRRRFTEETYRGGIVAKTGTLVETDFGVSTLVGFIDTVDYGLLVFAILNSHGDVFTFHRWQNDFLKGIIDRAGGIIPFRTHPQEEDYVFNTVPSFNQFTPPSQFAN
ncbi:D-alanyl-D-alanine carboxypeptidase [candidate division KSB1 bacterium]|nr:D-alanyl-D-alanine carboxypeptidase [candidate division KSB1 bacterium]